MKKIILSALIIAGISLHSCGNAEENGKAKDNKAETSYTSDDIKPGKVTKMDKQMFINRVMNFEKNKDVWVYEGDKPCVIDFYADWCKPCKLIAPIMEELAEEYKDDIYIYKVNTDQQKELATVFGIRSIPAVLFVPMDGRPQMSTGAMPKETFKQAIDNFLLKKNEENK